MTNSHSGGRGRRNFGRFHLLSHSVGQGGGFEWLRGHFDKAWRVFGVIWWRTFRRHFMVLVGDISFVSDLDAKSLADTVGQSRGFVGVMTDVDGVHSDILRVDLQEQDELLELPGGGGRELEDNYI